MENDVKIEDYIQSDLGALNVLEENTKIELSYVTKRFDMISKKSIKMKELSSFRKKEPLKFWALRGISFRVEAGESIGIIGVNGSGKSTLSNIIAGIIPPTTGQVKVNGEVSIISISSGLKNALTGLENIKLKLLMSGYTDTQIEDLIEDIILFSELGEQIYQPIKSYSSGMRSRLGFSIMVHMNPDIMIVDEALAVGDATFKQKCEAKIAAFKKQGKTFVLVSHNLREIERLCEKAVWIHRGELRQFGESKKVVDDFKGYVKWYEKLDDKRRNEIESEKRKERMNFSVNDYYQDVMNSFELESEKLRLSEAFYESNVLDRMSGTTIALNVSLFIMLFIIVIRQIQAVLIYWSNWSA